jgi:predicted ATPase
MEETVQALFDEGALNRSDGTVTLVKPLASLRIPPTVQTILAAGIDQLRNDEKNLLQTLAVLGREFVFSLVRAVAGRSEEELERLFANLQLGEFVYEQPSISDVEYIFKHALTQEVAYNSILLERRKQLHEDAGLAIESLYSTSLDDHVADLAHHFSRSANQEKAVEYLRLAGMQAMSRSALPQAVQNLESALALLKTSPESPARDQLELQVLNPLGTAYIAVRGYAAPEVGPVFQRARALCEIGGLRRMKVSPRRSRNSQKDSTRPTFKLPSRCSLNYRLIRSAGPDCRPSFAPFFEAEDCRGEDRLDADRCTALTTG